MALPSFETAASRRPVDLSRPGLLGRAMAPYVAIEVPVAGPVELAFMSGADRLAGSWDGTGCALEVISGGLRPTHHRSRRSGKAKSDVERLALTLTGTRLAIATLEDGTWTVRGIADLRDRVDTHDETWLAGLTASGGELRGFGQLGLRDIRVVTHADGTPYRRGDDYLLTATSAGPGFFETAHTSVWSLDPVALTLTHCSDLFFRRPDRPGVYGDHASHLLRLSDEDGDRWLLATSTWGDFDLHRSTPSVAAALAVTTEDLLTGRHVLDTRPLDLPTTGLTSVGVWDPHLVRTGEGWLVGYVSARKFFRFHPVLASGPTLDRLTMRGAATPHDETEGSTLFRTAEGWRLLASDGVHRRYPVFDLEVHETGDIDAPYPSNIPWPTLLEHDGELLMIGFDGDGVGGRLVGYGSHGTVHLMRARS